MLIVNTETAALILKAGRKAAGLSIRQVAAMTNHSKTSIARNEDITTSNPTLDILLDLCRAYGYEVRIQKAQ